MKKDFIDEQKEKIKKEWKLRMLGRKDENKKIAQIYKAKEIKIKKNERKKMMKQTIDKERDNNRLQKDRKKREELMENGRM